MDHLEKIVDQKRKKLRLLEQQVPLSRLKKQLESKASTTSPKRPTLKLTTNSFQVIAEIKRASPSKGLIPWSHTLEELISAYESGGASIISVLTEEDFFQGGLNDFHKVRSLTTLPLLRKDFLFSEYQILESALLEADMILLIARILDAKTLASLLHLACELGLQSLVECSEERDIERALEAGAKIIGINNRDLSSFQVTLQRTQILSNLVPRDCILVSESGIRTPEDAALVSSYGAHAVLVGESCLGSSDPSLHIRSLREAGLKAQEVGG